MNTLSKQIIEQLEKRICKGIKGLKDTSNHPDLIDIYADYTSKTYNIHFTFLDVHGMFTRIDHIVAHKKVNLKILKPYRVCSLNTIELNAKSVAIRQLGKPQLL